MSQCDGLPCGCGQGPHCANPSLPVRHSLTAAEWSRTVECVVPGFDGPVIFLDFDGVSNGHQKYPNGYARTQWHCVQLFNQILERVPEAKIVISSSWRYMVHSGSMSIEGMQNLMLALGFNCYGRVIGVTCLDEEYQGDMTKPEFLRWLKENGCQVRARQIAKWVIDHLPHGRPFVVLDDFPVPIVELVQSHGKKGLRPQEVDGAAAILNNEMWPRRTRCLKCCEVLEPHGPLEPKRDRCQSCNAVVPPWQHIDLRDVELFVPTDRQPDGSVAEQV